MKRLLLLVVALATSQAWHTCDDTPFCKTIRDQTETVQKFHLVESSILRSATAVEATLQQEGTEKRLSLKLTGLANGTVRIQIDDPEKPRHTFHDALNGEPEVRNIEVTKAEGLLQVQNGEVTVDITASPFVIKVTTDKVSIVINEGQRLEFKSGDDEAIALDFKFPEAKRAYGIPEHADRLTLKNTKGTNPYRLFNVDYCCYALETKESLYGAVPVLYAHSEKSTSGIFWLNTAQSFVDIDTQNGVESLFISQSGVVDLFVFVGPTLQDTVKQYVALTGTAPLPQLFAIGYHQSRYSYFTQQEVQTVITELDNNDFPVDVIWLDIDYTDSKKYFTWDYSAFPDPVGMQDFLRNGGRKLVTIIDPHIKVEQGYHVYDQAKANNYFVKEEDGTTDFEGICWPGQSSYIDFTNPAALDWWSSLYSFDNYPGSTDITYIWNDMNEPSVFEVDENTMRGSLLHHDNWKHRDVHNTYGFLQTKGTFNGLLNRSNAQKRPFILTRSHFAGSQRYTAVWTGDNVANWDHMRISIPMCLTEALAGISFCGADVGGFVDNPDDELLQRWFQLGSWLPFFREHNAIDTNRREPYLFPEDIQSVIRAAIKTRYAYLPYWYTLWFEHERNGEPVIRPLTYHFSSDSQVLDTDDHFLVGGDILVRPVLDAGATNVNVYLPGGADQIWYDIQNGRIYYGTGTININVNINSVPVYHRGGSIVPRKDTSRQSSVYMAQDPITLYVFADLQGTATGTVYIDDFESYNYRSKRYTYMRYSYNNGVLSSEKIDDDTNYEAVVIGRVLVYQPNTLKSLRVAERVQSEFETEHGDNYVAFNNLNLNAENGFSIKLM